MNTQKITNTIVRCVLAMLAAAVMAAAPIYSQETLSGGYEFGPGLAQTARDDVRLNVPARTNVTFLVLLQRNLMSPRGLQIPTDVPVVVEVFRPDGTLAASQAASATVVSSGIPVPVVPVVGTFTSQQGCPSAWTVRIRSVSTLGPPVRIFGNVTFGFMKPGTTNLDMEGDVALNAGTSVTRNISGHQLVGNSDRALIAGTGVFRIRAKWHTDPLDLNPAHFNHYFKAKVELLRPNNTVAASEEGFSRHSPTANTPKIDFSYTATAADQVLTGAWKVRVSNLAGNPRIVGFDLEKGLVDPLAPTLAGFNSTFTPQCSTAIAVN